MENTKRKSTKLSWLCGKLNTIEKQISTLRKNEEDSNKIRKKIHCNEIKRKTNLNNYYAPTN